MAYINGKHTMVNVNVYGGIPDAPSGSVIYAVTMGLSRDCVVGTDYAAELEAFTYPENIKYGDYMIDGDSSCWFQYCELEDGEASLGGYTAKVICVANPNGKAEGAMVFKGVVSELPETANEGEVYKRYGYISECVGWAFESYDNTFKIYPDRIEFGTETDIFAEVSNYLSKENGAMVHLRLQNYDTEETHYINATKAENNILYGTTDVENNYVVGSGTMEFIREGIVNKTMIYHNGEWVEL